MLHNFKLYLRLLNVQIISQMQYRTSFVFLLVGTGLVTILEFGSLALAMQRFDTILGWTVGEVAFLYGMVQIGFGTMDMVFSGFDPGDFGQKVRKGTFDQVLLRPLPATLQVLGSQLALRRVGRIVMGFGILAYSFSLVSIAWTPLKIILVPILLLSMSGFFGALFVIGATITFWTVESVEIINILTYGGSYVISHPMHILQKWLRDFFTLIIPAIFLNYYPALYILNKTDPIGIPVWGPFAGPIVAILALTAAGTFWRFGLRHYQSSGS